MPFIDDPDYVGLPAERLLELRTPAEHEAKPRSFGEELDAAFDLHNEVVSALNAPRQSPMDPDFDPFEHLEPGEELIADRFSRVNSLEDMAAIRTQLDRESDARRILGEGGLSAVAAEIIATVASPTMLLPVFGFAGKATALARAAKVGIGGAADAAVSEAILQGTQLNRPVEETVGAILMGGAFGGVIGGTVGAVAARRAANEAAMNDFKAIYRDIAEETGYPLPAKPESAGAAASPRLAPEDTELAGNVVFQGAAKALAKLSKIGMAAPGLELAMSPNAASREAGAHLVDVGLFNKGHMRGVAGPQPVELEIRMDSHVANVSLDRAARDGYRAHKAAGGTMSRIEFQERVGHAARNNDTDADATVTTTARSVRASVVDELKGRAIAAKRLPEDVQVEEALSYFTRVYDKEKIKARRPVFHARVMAYLGRVTDKNRLANEGELDFDADSIVNAIQGAPGGDHITALAKLSPNLRGPMKGRTFHIPDEDIEDFLVNDFVEVNRRYIATMVPDIALANLSTRLGFDGRPDNLAKDLARRINDEAVAAGKATMSEKERTAITDRAKSEAALIEDLIDGIRGTDKAALDPRFDGFRRIGKSIRTLTYMTKLGSVVISSLTDAARPVMVEGFTRTFGLLMSDMTNGFKAIRMGREQAQAAGTAVETALSARSKAIFDIGERYANETAFERWLDAVGQKFGNIVLLNPWTDAIKSVSSVLASTRTLGTIEKLSKGQVPDAKDITMLAQSGIDEHMAARIFAQAEHWDRYGYAITANIADWTDPAASRAFRQALLRDVDHTVITPGRGDAPLWTTTDWGKMVFQFKRFGFASTQRIFLSGLQNADKSTAAGLTLMVGLGGLATALRDITRDGEVKDRTPAEWANEAMDRGGILSMLYEADSISNKLTFGNVSLQGALGLKETSKFQSRDGVGQLLGPSAGTVSELSRAATGVFEGEFTKADMRAIRRIIPYQNFFVFTRIFSALEEEIAAASGIPDKQPREKKAKSVANLP